MKKRISAILLSLLLLVSSVGCAKTPTASNTPSSAAPAASGETNAPKEEYVIDYMQPEGDTLNSEDTPVGKILKEKFNVSFHITSFTGDYDAQVALMLSGGNYPEIMRLRNGNDIQKYVKAGALVELESLANQCGATDFLTFHKDSIPIWKLGSGNGKLYTWESNSPQIALSSDVIVRSDVLEAAGYPDVLTEDEWINLLKIGMEKFPTVDGQPTIGMTFPGGESYGVEGIQPVMFEKGGYTDLAENGPVIYNNKEDKFEDYFLNKYVKSSFRFFNRLYKEGLLDSECFTDLAQQTQEKVVSGRALSVFYAGWDAGTANQGFREAGKPEMEYVWMPVMSQDQIDAGENRCFREMQSYIWSSYAITKNCKHPERIMEVLNYASTEEGAVLLGSGIEGVHYTIDSDGKRQPTKDFVSNCVSDGTYAYKQGIDSFLFLGSIGMPDASGQYYQMWRNESYKSALLSDRTKEVYSHYGWEGESDMWYKNDRFGITMVKSGVVNSTKLDPTSAEGKLGQQLVDYRNKAAVQLALADDFEAAYAELVEGYKKLNPETVVDAINKMYEKNKAAIK